MRLQMTTGYRTFAALQGVRHYSINLKGSRAFREPFVFL
jgi:hypothetical protein